MFSLPDCRRLLPTLPAKRSPVHGTVPDCVSRYLLYPPSNERSVESTLGRPGDHEVSHEVPRSSFHARVHVPPPPVQEEEKNPDVLVQFRLLRDGRRGESSTETGRTSSALVERGHRLPVRERRVRRGDTRKVLRGVRNDLPSPFKELGRDKPRLGSTSFCFLTSKKDRDSKGNVNKVTVVTTVVGRSNESTGILGVLTDVLPRVWMWSTHHDGGSDVSSRSS